MANKNLGQQKKNQKMNLIKYEHTQKTVLIKNSYVFVLGDFNAKIGNDQEGIENGDRIISRNVFLLRDMVKMQHLQLINCVACFVGKWNRVNTCNNNEKPIIDCGLCSSELTSVISKVIIDEPQEYKLNRRTYSDHNTFIIDINTKTKHLEMVGKSVWKINEESDWKKYKELMQNKIQNYDWNTKNSTEYTGKIVYALKK